MLGEYKSKKRHHRVDDHSVGETVEHEAADRKSDHSDTHGESHSYMLRKLFVFGLSYFKEIAETNPIEPEIDCHPEDEANNAKLYEYLQVLILRIKRKTTIPVRCRPDVACSFAHYYTLYIIGKHVPAFDEQLHVTCIGEASVDYLFSSQECDNSKN